MSAFDEALNDVSARTGVAASDIMGRRRLRHVVQARAELVRVLRGKGWSYPAIGEKLGRDHTSVMHLAKLHQAGPAVCVPPESADAQALVSCA